MMITSCAKDDNIILENEDNRAVVELPVLEDGDDIITRSTLYFAGGSGMKFEWNDGEQVGLYPIGNTRVRVQAYQLTNISTSETSSKGYFYPGDSDVASLADGTKYVAYSKYLKENSEKAYNAVPVDYRGQKQEANEYMGYYPKNNDAYLESAKVAGKHLGDVNFLVSSATTTAENQIYLKFSYMGATVRFYLSVPDADVVYDELTVLNKDTKFFVAGTMDLEHSRFNDKGKEESNTLSLTLGDAGFEMSNDKTYYDTKKSHMIVAYMEVAPVNLTTTSTLFLKGHRAGGEKRYYKATLSTKNILAGKAYQWSVTPESDEPITFTAIEVQEWEDGVKYNNNGEGTGNW